MDKFLLFVSAAMVTLVMMFAYGLIIAIPLMLIWDYIMPALFGLTTITYWQAFLLYILSFILFASKSNSK